MANNSEIKPFVFYSDKLNYKSIDGKKGKEFFVEGYISTDDVDLVNDIVTKSCMDSMLKQFDNRTIKLDFEHEAFRGNSELDAEANKTRLALGKAVDRSRDSKGVKVIWKMNPTWKKFDEKGNITMTFKDIWTNVEDGYYDAFSIAYIPTKSTQVEREGKSIRLLDNVNLLNVALTGNPINPGASMTSVMAKSLEFLKGQEEIQPDLSLMEVKSQVDNLTSEISEIKSLMEKNKMVEEKDVPEQPQLHKEHEDVKEKETTTESVEKPAEPVEQPVETPVETEAPVEAPAPEEKSVDLKDVMSKIENISEEIKSLKEENAQLKAIIEKPMMKSKGAEDNKEIKDQTSNSFKGPLDMI